MKNRELPEYLAKQGISRHIKESNSYDKNTFHLPRQEICKVLGDIVKMGF